MTLPVCRGTVPGPGPDHCAEDASRNFDPVAGAVTYPQLRAFRPAEHKEGSRAMSLLVIGKSRGGAGPGAE